MRKSASMKNRVVNGRLYLLIYVKVLPKESCVLQHKLIVSTVVLKTCVRKVGKVFVRKCKVWKLKEAETRKRFQEVVQTRDASRVENDVEGGLVDRVERASVRSCRYGVWQDERTS